MIDSGSEPRPILTPEPTMAIFHSFYHNVQGAAICNVLGNRQFTLATQTGLQGKLSDNSHKIVG